MKREPRRPLSKLVAISLAIIAIWFVIGLFNTSEFYRRSVASGVPYDWYLVLLFQLSSSMNWAVLTPPIVFVAERFRIRRPWRLRNAAILIAFAVPYAYFRAAWGGVVIKLSERDDVTWEFVKHSIDVRVHRNIFIITVVIGLVHLIHAYREAAAGERHAFELQAELANAELAQLRLRLQPRFMAAALQEIRSRVRTSPDDADALLVRVSRLLRRSVDFDRSGDVTLREELDFIDQYLHVENLRLGGRLASRIDVADEELLTARVPPLLLQTIVGSVVMQSPAGGAIELLVRAWNGLTVEVRASRGASTAVDDTLDEARIRLKQLFGRNDAITSRRVADGWIITVTLPLRHGEDAAA
ncbi:MAG TPA: histidine kinase [Thermoanaerobaculia bacterium]